MEEERRDWESPEHTIYIRLSVGIKPDPRLISRVVLRMRQMRFANSYEAEGRAHMAEMKCKH